ncbi:MAG: L,D-transpeptidase [Polyangiales bacterium]|nr:L,D-transpeptidase [Myxococcales bacterium]MCB9657952.1 L,D-transpeptidase [Sandaracinaceae bacterium]
MAHLMSVLNRRRSLSALTCALPLIAFAALPGCEDPVAPPVAPAPVEVAEATPEPVEPPTPPPPPVLLHPVPVWTEGSRQEPIERDRAAEQGYLLVDLGDDWTPYLFTEVDVEGQTPIPNAYRSTYLALARGEHPDDHHGRRASRDKYLELYGIPPTLGLLRQRNVATRALSCAADIDYEPLRAFEGFIAYDSNSTARNQSRRHAALETELTALARRSGVTLDALDPSALGGADRRRLNEYRERHAEYVVIDAVQRRLQCEGHFEDKGTFIRGAMDWATHEALAEFERRHRIYGWGFIGRETLDALRKTPLENERDAVLRVLTERAVHAAGVIEDGSAAEAHPSETRFLGADGQRHAVRNLVAELEARVVASFGLATAEDVGAWLDSLGDLGGRQLVAVPAIELPEYYSSDIDLSVEVDRGDVWYEFPYDAEGRERAQPVSRRPHTTIYAQYRGQRIALARFGTTVGGWRSDNVGGRLMWRYKNSPAGPRVWSRIIASPVWLPPDSSPPRGLLVPAGGGRFEVNYDETGPSYASAYGLVAAYHQLYSEDPEGNIRLGGDQGIRMHGSVDYMSIMRRHSHGCHRLHNHIAVRLMSFVLRHRPHSRRGQQVLGFRRNIEFDGRSYPMAIDAGGYVFRLERPLPVNVLEGRVLGAQLTPIEHEIPKYDPEVGAYVMPDGQWVTVDRHGNITPREMPVPLEGTVEPGTEGIVGGPAVGDAADEAAEGLISGEDDQTTTPAGPAPSARPAAPGASPAAPAAAPTMAPGTPSPSPQSAAAHGGGASPRAATLTTTTPPRAP